MPMVLARCRDEDPEHARVATRAFRELSGVQSPSQGDGRRRAWWEDVSTRGSAELHQAWSALGSAPEAAEALLPLNVVLRLGWLDVPGARERLGTWFQGSDQALVTLAARIARHLALAEFAEELAAAERWLTVPRGGPIPPPGGAFRRR